MTWLSLDSGAGGVSLISKDYAKDNLDIVNYHRVYEIALAIQEIINNLNK